MLGALTLTGTPPVVAAAAVIVYRVAGYWAVGAAGTAVAVTLTRRRPRARAATHPSSQRAAMTRARTALRPWQRAVGSQEEAPTSPASHYTGPAAP